MVKNFNRSHICLPLNILKSTITTHPHNSPKRFQNDKMQFHQTVATWGCSRLCIVPDPTARDPHTYIELISLTNNPGQDGERSLEVPTKALNRKEGDTAWWAPSSWNCLAWNHPGSPYSSHFLYGRVCIEHPSVILSCEKWQWVLLGWSLVWMWAVTSWLVPGGPPKSNHYLKIPRVRHASENLCQERCCTVDTVLRPPCIEIAGSVCSQETILEWRHFQERILQQ